MVRPAASEENKQIGLLFAKAVRVLLCNEWGNSLFVC
jgi:hypothetical protein